MPSCYDSPKGRYEKMQSNVIIFLCYFECFVGMISKLSLFQINLINYYQNLIQQLFKYNSKLSWILTPRCALRFRITK